MSSKNENTITNIQYPFQDKWDKDKNHVTFTLKNVHYSLANAIRRCAISDVETIGFRSEPSKYSSVKISRNDTILNNQQISHRIAMVPINVGNLSRFDVDDYEFILDEVNTTNSVKVVTTQHFKVRRISTNKFLSETEVKQLLPPSTLSGDYIPIVKLEPKYYTNIETTPDLSKNISEAIKVPVSESVGLSLTAKCVKSTGVENGHFSPISVCVYGNTRDNEKARQALKDPSHNPAWANSKSKMEASVVPSPDGKSLVPMKKAPEPKAKPVPNSQFGLPRLKKEATYGTQAQRMMSPLQKARQDNEKADRDRHGKLHMMKGRPKKLGEISQDLKKRYTDKAKSDYGHQQFSADIAREMGAKDAEKYYRRKQRNRMAGITKASK